jgi:aminopeptidase N
MEIHIEDYIKPHYIVNNIKLKFDIYDDHVLVYGKYDITMKSLDKIILNGSDSLELLSFIVNEKIIEYEKKDNDIIFTPDAIENEIRIIVKINPYTNTDCMGLYYSSPMLSTQNEPEGFRNIIYFFDRPDVMSRYETIIEANKAKYPVLLSNGNLIEHNDIDNNRHYVKYYDPHNKPCYLFALVAGKIDYIEDYHYKDGIINNENKVTIRIYSSEEHMHRLDIAMLAIKDSMKFDEENFGRYYDLNIFNIVGLDDFNSGAMENKSLNIFNASCLLSDPELSSDNSNLWISSIVAHEYFHNWTGNRITLNKWFELTLKEGLTVFRDNLYSESIQPSKEIFRIETVKSLKHSQFIEDDSDMAHAIRPRSYFKIDNFYSATVYDKGCEIVRIYHTLLGKEGFRKGMDLYFDRHDGQAVQVEDFWKAMYDGNKSVNILNYDDKMNALFNWYDQPGTPKLRIEYEYDNNDGIFRIDITQSNLKCMELNDGIYNPVYIPIRFGLLDEDGNEISSGIIDCYKLSQIIEIVVGKDHKKIIPSFLRDFSAPVNLDCSINFEDKLFLVNNDTSYFNRWYYLEFINKEIISSLYKKEIDYLSEDYVKYISTLRNIFLSSDDNPTKTELLTLPSTSIFIGIENYNPNKIREIYKKIYIDIVEGQEEFVFDKIQFYMNKQEKDNTYTKQNVIDRKYLMLYTNILSYSLNSDYKLCDLLTNFYFNINDYTNKMIVINALENIKIPKSIIFKNNLLEIAKDNQENNILSKKNMFNYVLLVLETPEIILDIIENRNGFKFFNKTSPNDLSYLLQFIMSHSLYLTPKENTYPFIDLICDILLDFDKTNPSVASGIIRNIFLIKNKYEESIKNYLNEKFELFKKSELSELSQEIISKIN